MLKRDLVGKRPTPYFLILTYLLFIVGGLIAVLIAGRGEWIYVIAVHSSLVAYFALLATNRLRFSEKFVLWNEQLPWHRGRKSGEINLSRIRLGASIALAAVIISLAIQAVYVIFFSG